MRVVGIAIIAALLSAGCALQAGDPLPEDTQHPSELVSIPGGSQTGVNARPQALPRAGVGQTGPAADSPNPSPWTSEGSGDPHANGEQGNGGNGNTDNPNPSPWANPSAPNLGSAGNIGSKGGTGG
jgi:hypothetical protein